MKERVGDGKLIIISMIVSSTNDDDFISRIRAALFAATSDIAGGIVPVHEYNYSVNYRPHSTAVRQLIRVWTRGHDPAVTSILPIEFRRRCMSSI